LSNASFGDVSLNSFRFPVRVNAGGCEGAGGQVYLEHENPQIAGLGGKRMIFGMDSVPMWFYVLAICVVILFVLFAEWWTR